MHGFYSYLLQDDGGNPLEAYSISAGLDYPGIGPEHSLLPRRGARALRPVTDAEALEAFALLCRTEGIIPAIESSTRWRSCRVSPQSSGARRRSWSRVSGRGDKDIDIVREAGLG